MLQFLSSVSMKRLVIPVSSSVVPPAVDDAGKMVSGDGEEVTVEGAIDDQEVEKDEDGQEVIKVYIFKADSGEDDLGEWMGDLSQCCFSILSIKLKYLDFILMCFLH